MRAVKPRMPAKGSRFNKVLPGCDEPWNLARRSRLMPLPRLGHCLMRTDETFLQVQRAQAELRLSIEKSKELAAQSDRLLARHRGAGGRANPPNPAWS